LHGAERRSCDRDGYTVTTSATPDAR